MKVQNAKLSDLKKLNAHGVTKSDYSLKPFTTFRIGGNTKFYLEIKTLEDFIKVMMYLKTKSDEVFVLGGGSNVLISDKGFGGITIKLAGDFDRIIAFDDVIEMGAGVKISQALKFCADESLSGFEDAIGIPGTIGGATYMNASAHNFQTKNIIDYVVAYDFKKIIFLNGKDCNFGYRDSIFQHGKYIILRVGFKLTHTDKSIILARQKQVLKLRLDSQPKGLSAGSVFKNQDGICVSRMLDEMGAKGMQANDAIVSTKHANFILNTGNAKSEDVATLINLLKDKFYKYYGINLETEIKYIGDFEWT